MGNLEKVLIVIILATIAIITALAFLDSGSEPGDDLTARRTGTTAAELDENIDDDEAQPTGSPTSGDDSETAGNADETGNGETSGVQSYFRNRDGNSGESTRNLTALDDETLEPVIDPDAAGGDDGSDAPMNDASEDLAVPELSRPELSRRGPGGDSPVQPKSSVLPGSERTRPATIDDEPSRTEPARHTYTPGSRRYVTTAGDTWASIARTVYGNRDYADAVRDANIDVGLGGNRLDGGIALYIVPKDELEDDLKNPARTVQTHVVKKGETLSGISRLYYQQERRWKEILLANSDLMATDRDLRAGMVLRIPPK